MTLWGCGDLVCEYQQCISSGFQTATFWKMSFIFPSRVTKKNMCPELKMNAVTAEIKSWLAKGDLWELWSIQNFSYAKAICLILLSTIFPSCVTKNHFLFRNSRFMPHGIWNTSNTMVCDNIWPMWDKNDGISNLSPLNRHLESRTFIKYLDKPFSSFLGIFPILLMSNLIFDV